MLSILKLTQPLNTYLPEKYYNWKSEPLEPDPGELAIDLGLHHRGFTLLKLKRVDEPEAEIHQDKKSDHLPPSVLVIILFGLVF